MILVISMVDLVGIDIHIVSDPTKFYSNFSLKSQTKQSFKQNFASVLVEYQLFQNLRGVWAIPPCAYCSYG